jgi:uncharacterized protein (DUF1800 family)
MTTVNRREFIAQEPKALAPIPSGAKGAVLAATAVLAACGGGKGESGTPPAGAAPTVTVPAGVAPTVTEQAARFLMQAQFSASDEEIASVGDRNNYGAWLDKQMEVPISKTAVQWLYDSGYGETGLNKPQAEQHSYYYRTYPVEFAVWKDLLSAPDAVRKRVALALSEIFVVSINGPTLSSWTCFGFAKYWDILNINAFGNFRQLLEDVTLSSMMGVFLNITDSQKENPATGRLPDENYAREIMQLFTIGLYELNNDGTLSPNSTSPKETYTQDDVTNLARVFTGWDQDDQAGWMPVPGNFAVRPIEDAIRPLRLKNSEHSFKAVTFLGKTINENTPGKDALKAALDHLFNHKNVGPFIGKQLIQRLVTSNPSPAYVNRVANAFNNNGSNVRGDMKAVIRAVLLDDEARNAKNLTNQSFGKLREPMLRLVQWARTFEAKSKENTWKIMDTSDPALSLGQSPFRSPSVFNFFRPGYVPPNTALAKTKSTAPEFQIVNETTVGGYLNYMQDVIEKGISCPDPKNRHLEFFDYNRNYVPDVVATYAKELALLSNAATPEIAKADASALVQRINLLMCAGQISTATQKKMVAALTTPPLNTNSTQLQRQQRVWSAVLLTMACPEYLVQK